MGNNLDPWPSSLKGQTSLRGMLGWAGATGNLSRSALGSELSAFPQLVGLPLLEMPCFLTIMVSSWPCPT